MVTEARRTWPSDLSGAALRGAGDLAVPFSPEHGVGSASRGVPGCVSPCGHLHPKASVPAPGRQIQTHVPDTHATFVLVQRLSLCTARGGVSGMLVRDAATVDGTLKTGFTSVKLPQFWREALASRGRVVGKRRIRAISSMPVNRSTRQCQPDPNHMLPTSEWEASEILLSGDRSTPRSTRLTPPAREPILDLLPAGGDFPASSPGVQRWQGG